MNEHVTPTMNTNIAPRVRCLRLRFTARPSRPIPLPAAFTRRLPALPRFLLPLLLLAGISPLLSTALADGGAPAIVPVLQTTFTNPTPAGSSASFGAALAVMRNDRVVIGAPHAGVEGITGRAYLFDLNGALLYQFRSSGSSLFGWSIATMPNNDDYVYIGDTSGYLYWCSTNSIVVGGYVFRFSTPTPYAANDQFGRSLAALGDDRLIVGAPNSTLGAIVSGGVGAVFLYSSLDANPTPLTTITNPSPVPNGRFGASVAGVGDDRILIGAPGNSGNGGKAYLFNTNGLLLTSFTNPITYLSGAAAFGKSVAALGSDRVIISSQGRGFLFGVNGTLLTTFTPSPFPNAYFGSSVAAVGSDRVLIGGRQAGTNTGAAFLFSTNGTLLVTLTNPTGATNDSFGITVAAVGSDRVLVGDTSGTNGGAVYSFSLVPTLDIHPTPAPTLAVSWPLFAPDYFLQQNTNGLATANWSNVTDTIHDDGTNKYIIVDPATGNRFYRLIKP